MGRTVLIKVSSCSFPVLLVLFKVITTGRMVSLESLRVLPKLAITFATLIFSNTFTTFEACSRDYLPTVIK